MSLLYDPRSRVYSSIFVVIILFITIEKSNGQYRSIYDGNSSTLAWEDYRSWEIFDGGLYRPATSTDDLPGNTLAEDVEVFNSMAKASSLTVGGGHTLDIFPYDPLFLPPSTGAEMVLNGNLVLNGNGPNAASVVVHPGASLIITGIFSAKGNANLTIMDDASLTIQGGVEQDSVSGTVGTFTFDIGVGAQIDISGGMLMKGTVVYNVFGNVVVDGPLNFLGDVNVFIDETDGYWYQNGDVDLCSSIWDIYDSTTWAQNQRIVLTVDPSVVNFDCSCWQGPDDAIDGPGCQSSLPVELIDFVARSRDRLVELVWTTAWEEVNDYFTIERSGDGINYSVIGTVDGKGTTSDNQDYTYEDRSPLMGKSYYRLSQTDFDGTKAILGILSVDYSSPTNTLIVYPNPVQNENLTVQLTGLIQEQSASLKIVDLGGREILNESWITSKGYIDRALNLENLNAGIYILTIQKGSEAFRQKIIKN